MSRSRQVPSERPAYMRTPAQPLSRPSTDETRAALVAHLRERGWVHIAELAPWAAEQGLTIHQFGRDLRVLVEHDTLERRPTSSRGIYRGYEYRVKATL